jgi:glycerol-3-phosphate acyltransferase PlsY
MTEVTWPEMGDINWPAVVAAGVVSYAVGSLSPAAAAARLRGVDLRGSGSGNPGATNAARAMGVKVGVVVGALDVAKGYAPVMYFNQYGEPCGEVAGIAAVLGHVTSPLLRGRGGKGVATSLGAILAIEPLWAVPVLVSFGATVGLTHRVGMGSVVGSLALLPTSLIIKRGWAGVGFAAGMSAVVLYRHRRNIGAYVAQLRDPGPAAAEGGLAETGAGSVGTGAGPVETEVGLDPEQPAPA